MTLLSLECTIQVIFESPPVKPKRKTLQTVIVSVLIVAVVLWVAGAIATELTNKVPMTGETIKTDLAWPGNLGKSVVEDVQKLFENRSDPLYGYPYKGSLTVDNSITITNFDTIKNISPLPPAPTAKHDVYLLEPVANLDVSNPVKYGMDLEGKGISSPFQEQYKREAIENNVKSMFLLKNVAKDSIILAPIDGILRYFADNVPNGTIGGAEIVFTALDGTEEEINVAGNDILPFTPLIEGMTPFTGHNAPTDVVYVQVKRGQPIMKTLQPGDILMMSIAQPDKTNSSILYPTNINLLSIPDPKTGVQKTVIVANQ